MEVCGLRGVNPSYMLRLARLARPPEYMLLPPLCLLLPPLCLLLPPLLLLLLPPTLASSSSPSSSSVASGMGTRKDGRGHARFE